MLIFIRILQRKDAASIIVAIVLGLVFAQFVSVVGLGVSAFFSLTINQVTETPAAAFDWRVSLFNPAMLLLLQVVVLELTLRLGIAFRDLVIKLKKNI